MNSMIFQMVLLFISTTSDCFTLVCGGIKEPDSLKFFQANGMIAEVSLDGHLGHELVGHGLYVTGKQLVFGKEEDQLYWFDHEGVRICHYDVQSGKTGCRYRQGSSRVMRMNMRAIVWALHWISSIIIFTGCRRAAERRRRSYSASPFAAGGGI